MVVKKKINVKINSNIKTNSKKPKTFKRIYLSKKDKMIAGVCGGLGEYLNIDPVIIRLIWVIGTIVSFGFGILIYLLAWLIIPERHI